jgi:multidrug transporter EmrE-like cation transporter
VRAGFWLLAIGWVCLVVLALSGNVVELDTLLGQETGLQVKKFGFRLTAVEIASLPVGIYLYALWQLQALLRLYASGALLTSGSVDRLKQLGIAVALAPLGLMATQAMLCGVVYLVHGGRNTGFAVDANLTPLILGLVLTLLAHMMAEARGARMRPD